MKRFVLFLLAMCSFTFSYSQLVEDLLTPEEKEYTEKTKDDAFLAPMSKLVGKKWYLYTWRYLIFNQNGTGVQVSTIDDDDYTYPIKAIKTITFRWKRNGVDMKHLMTPKLWVYQPVESSLSKLSPREKAKVKKDYAEWQTKDRNKDYDDAGKWYEDEIYKLTNDILILRWGGDQTLYFVTKKKLDEIMARSKE